MEEQDITEAIIGAAFEVHNILGYGFLEKVYQQALLVELGRRGICAEKDLALVVRYKDVAVGHYFADLLVEGKVVVELKAVPRHQTADEAQLLNELKASGHRLGLLINFGRHKVEFKRMIF